MSDMLMSTHDETRKSHFFWTGADEESRQCHVKKAATGRAWH